MKTNYVGLVMVEPHIKAYWLKRHGIEGPLNDDPKNAFLVGFMAQIARIINLVDASRAKGITHEKLKEIHHELYKNLQDFDEHLRKMEIAHFGDEAFCELMHVLGRDVEGARLHINMMRNSTEDPSKLLMINIVYLIGGNTIHMSSQYDNPFYGSQLNNEKQLVEQEGFCLGVVRTWGNNQPYNTREIFIRQDTGRVNRNRTTSTASVMKLNTLFPNNLELAAPSYYGILKLASSTLHHGHAIGVRQCTGSPMFNVIDPNFGEFSFKNKNDAVKYLEFLIAYYNNNENLAYDSVSLHRETVPNRAQAAASMQEPLEIKANEASPAAILAIVTPQLLDDMSLAAKKIARDRRGPQNMPIEMHDLKLYIDALKQHNQEKEKVELINLLMNKNYFHVVSLACVGVLNVDAASIDQSQNETMLMRNIFINHASAATTDHIQLFDKLPNDQHKRFLLECLIKYKIPFNTLSPLMNTFITYPNILKAIAPSGMSAAVLGKLAICDLPDMLKLSEIMFHSKAFDISARQLYVLTVISGIKSHNPQITHFNDAEFLSIMGHAINQANENTTKEEIINETCSKFNVGKAEKLMANTSLDADSLDELIKLCEIINNEEWNFIKRYAEALKSSNPETRKSFMQDPQNMELYLKYFDRCHRLSLLHPNMQIIYTVHQHLMSHLPDLVCCERLQAMHQNMIGVPVDVDALCHHLSKENQRFLVPILMSNTVLNKMTNEQFEKMMERILSLDPEKGIMMLNDAVLNREVIKNLSLAQVAILVKFLVTPGENGRAPAEALQYDERASIATKSNEHAAFPHAKASLMSGMINNKTRWAQVVDELRGQANNFINKGDIARNIAAVGKENMVYVNELSNRNILDKFAQPRNQASSSSHPKN